MVRIANNYIKDKEHNTLNKLLMVDLLHEINAIANDQTSENLSPIHKQMKRAGVTSYVLFGGGSYNFIEKPIPYPRNTDDLDLMVLGNKSLSHSLAKQATRKLFECAAERVGARMEAVELRDESLTHLNRAAMIAGLRDRLFISTAFTPERLRDVLKKPEHYHLQPQDVQVIEEMISRGRPVAADFKVDLRSIPTKTDLPPVDFAGNELTLDQNKFNGVVVENYLEQAMKSVNALSDPERDKPTDFLGLYNMSVLCGNEDGRLKDDDITRVHQNMFHVNSALTAFHRARRAAHFDIQGTWLGMIKHRMPEPTEEKINEIKVQFDELYKHNLIGRQMTLDEVRNVCAVGYENYTALIGDKPKRMERIRVEREKQARGSENSR